MLWRLEEQVVVEDASKEINTEAAARGLAAAIKLGAGRNGNRGDASGRSRCRLVRNVPAQITSNCRWELEEYKARQT